MAYGRTCLLRPKETVVHLLHCCLGDGAEHGKVDTVAESEVLSQCVDGVAEIVDKYNKIKV